MNSTPSPAITAWMSRPGDSFRIAEIVMDRSGTGYLLRHAVDAGAPFDSLVELAPDALREWAQRTDGGVFRPNKFAPGLRRGWWTRADEAAALKTALDGLYPGAIADWFSVETGTAIITSFRDFTSRQTGMYRNSGQHSDARASELIRSGCAPRCCLRRRMWSVDGLNPDGAGEKSEIPCLEPCALLLEFSRRTHRQDQDPQTPLALGTGEFASLHAALRRALENPDPTEREGDSSSPLNVRRLLLLSDKLNASLRPVNSEGPDKEV